MTHPRSTEGFTLIEILISVVLLSLVAAGLAGGLLATSRQSRTAGLVSGRGAVMNSEVSRLSATPTTALVAGTTTATVIRGGVAFTRTTEITTATDSIRARVIVAPPTGRGVAPDTVVLTRTLRASSANPFSP